MTREQLEHVIRAAAEITGDPEIVVVGSTSILGQFPNAPLELLGSIEADIYPRSHPERFEMLDVIGELSRFHDTFGYYADPVQHDLPRLPAGWAERLIPVPVATRSGGRIIGILPRGPRSRAVEVRRLAREGSSVLIERRFATGSSIASGCSNAFGRPKSIQTSVAR